MPPASPKAYEWSSKLDGWHERARPHPAPPSIDFGKANILMASHYSAVGGSGFNMALFELDDGQNVAVDSVGRVVILDGADATAFNALMDKTVALPTKAYRIQHMVTCQAFTIVYLAASNGGFEEFSIYGYRKSMRDLEENAGQLPESLWELYGLADQGTGRHQGQERDEDVLKAVNDRVNHLQDSTNLFA